MALVTYREERIIKSFKQAGISISPDGIEDTKPFELDSDEEVVYTYNSGQCSYGDPCSSTRST